MRLTSYNMAVKILQAKGCLADMVDRMWAYMEEGDTENAQCVREKALGLYSLIETAGRWRPTISNGHRTVIYADVQALSWASSPVISTPIVVNGISTTHQAVFNATAEEYADALVLSASCVLSENDDLISVSCDRTGGNTTKTTIISSFEPTSIASPTEPDYSGTIITITDSSEFSDAVPYCLTDAQIISVVGKIDELCDCKC